MNVIFLVSMNFQNFKSKLCRKLLKNFLLNHFLLSIFNTYIVFSIRNSRAQLYLHLNATVCYTGCKKKFFLIYFFLHRKLLYSISFVNICSRYTLNLYHSFYYIYLLGTMLLYLHVVASAFTFFAFVLPAILTPSWSMHERSIYVMTLFNEDSTTIF